MAKGDEPHQDRQGEQPTGGIDRGYFMHCLSAEAIHEAEREVGTPGLRAMSADRSLNEMPEKDGGRPGSFRLSTSKGTVFSRSELSIDPAPGTRSGRLSRQYFRSYRDE